MRIIQHAILFFGLLNVAQAEIIKCPQNFNTTQSIEGNISGWESYSDSVNSPHRFIGVTFFYLHPKNLGSLAPDNEDTKGNKLIWTFSGNDRTDIWLACDYADTKVKLIKKLPDNIKNCTVTYDSQPITIYSNVKSVDCN